MPAPGKAGRRWMWLAVLIAAFLLLPLAMLLFLSLSSRRPTDLGLHGGALRDCPDTPNCVCTEASDSAHRMPPIPLHESADAALARMADIINGTPGGKVISRTDRYLHAEFTSRIFRFVDDVELLVDTDRNVIQFRSASRVGRSDLGVNRSRMEHLAAKFSEKEQGTPKSSSQDPPVSTFSIVAYDPERNEWGIGVASRFLAVGAVVPWARASSGAIATQSFANTTYGPRGLELLGQGQSAEEVLKLLTEADEASASRQVGIIDQHGQAATFTGEDCNAWAGGRTGKHYTCQGNLLAGPEVLETMEQAFLKEEGPLAWRIMAALEAADEAGGDVRGKQSAALLVVREKSGYGGFNDRMIDFRVDDHEEPISELQRILALRVKRPAPALAPVSQ